jgi:hypothetical protein
MIKMLGYDDLDIEGMILVKCKSNVNYAKIQIRHIAEKKESYGELHGLLIDLDMKIGKALTDLGLDDFS